jgi:trans-aconitate 2-methyltransferase
MPDDTWDPDQYHRFQAERSMPFFDLLALVEPVETPRLADLGCGTGELIAAAAARLGAREALGVDSSAAMLERAREHATDTLTFVRGDIGDFTPEQPFDVILSNAALHWVPDHPRTLARWSAALTDDGQLAVQMPANSDHPSHAVAAAVAHEPPFVDAFGDAPPPDPVAGVAAPAVYSQLLYDLGFTRQHVRLQVYPHVLGSTAEVVEWVKGTSLTRFRDALTPELFDEFVARYRERLLEVVGDRSPYLYTFKRVLFWARR